MNLPKRYPLIDYSQKPDTYFKSGTIHDVKYKFLPKLRRGEVEIVRIILESANRDITSLRVRKQKDGHFEYNIVDEYETYFCFAQPNQAEVLDLSEVINWIDGVSVEGINSEFGLGLLSITSSYIGGIPKEYLKEFTTIQSEFYPAITEHYRRKTNDWFAQTLSASLEISAAESLIAEGKAKDIKDALQMIKESMF